MKKNLEYYQHDANSHNHPKFKMLRLKYGWEGEGKFWALNNIIAKAENCKLNLNQGYNKAMAASDLQFTMEEFEAYLKYLCTECKLIRYKKNIVSTDTTQENYVKVHGDRVEARKRYEKKTSPKISENSKTSGEDSKTSGENLYKLNKSKSNQIKENKSKLNKNKPKEKKEIWVDFPKNGKVEEDQKQDPKLNGKATEYFEKFWKFYNRREGKREVVQEVFVDLIRTEQDYNNLITATRNYNDLVRGRPIEFIKLPINFISSYKDFIKVDN